VGEGPAGGGGWAQGEEVPEVSAEDYLPLGWDDGEWWFKRPSRPTCARCGMRGLFWFATEHGWRLYNGGAPHVCPKDPKKEFEDLDA